MKTLLSLSGGLDSSVLLAHLVSLGHSVKAVSFNYGSKHNEYELQCAAALANHYKIDHTVIDMRSVFQWFDSSLLLSGDAIPEGHYEAETMKSTVVPGRNMIFAAILAGMADSRKLEAIALGVHTGDHAIYPDCRPEFIISMHKTIVMALGRSFSVYTPFLYMSKGDIVRKGVGLEVPFEMTRTCYKHQEIACGKCGSCTERKMAFDECSANDPIPYEA